MCGCLVGSTLVRRLWDAQAQARDYIGRFFSAVAARLRQVPASLSVISFSALILCVAF
jgi:hypothetical protein